MADTAENIMSRNVISVKPETRVPEIARLLYEKGISAVPVIDKSGKLMGIVSEGDLMAPFSMKNQAKRAWWLDMLAEGERLAPEFLEYVSTEHHKAADLMTRTLVTVTESTKIGDISDLLMQHAIKRVPVLRGDQVVGIVSRADIVRAMAAGVR